MRMAWLVMGVSIVAVTGCGFLSPSGGDGLAQTLAERVAIAIADDTAASEPLDADYLALRAISDFRVPSDQDVSYQVETIGWDGNSGDDDGAHVELRIVVDVEARYASDFGEQSRNAGSATRCWTLTVRAVPDWQDDAWNLDEFGCPEGAPAATPAPTPLLTLPRDAGERLQAIVSSAEPGASTDEIEAAVRQEFSDPGYTVIAERGGEELAVALGVPRERSCTVVVADAQGDVSVFNGFPRVQLEPGEGGCTPGLYFSPISPPH